MSTKKKTVLRKGFASSLVKGPFVPLTLSPYPSQLKRPHNHYYKDVSHLKDVDVYRVLRLFEVTDPGLQHAIKKLLVAGKRGTKDSRRDICEAIDSLQRTLEMDFEDLPG